MGSADADVSTRLRGLLVACGDAAPHRYSYGHGHPNLSTYCTHPNSYAYSDSNEYACAYSDLYANIHAHACPAYLHANPYRDTCTDSHQYTHTYPHTHTAHIYTDCHHHPGSH